MTTKLLPQSEREALETFLDAQRTGLIRKVEGVGDELGRQAPTASSLSLIYRAQIEKSKVIAAATDLDARCTRPDLVDCNLRYVMFHLIEETARHAGHADIIRETLDGARGL
jgi:hypothetical protein